MYNIGYKGEKIMSESLLDLMSNFKNNMSKLEIDIVFVDSNYQRIHRYKEYKLLIDGHEEEIYPTVNGMLDYISSEVSKRSFENYDLELNIDDTVQIVEKSKVINSDALLSETDQIIVQNDNVLDDSINFKNLNFIIIKLYDSDKDKKLYLFQKYIHQTVKYKISFN